jgi:hypothetical protein
VGDAQIQTIDVLAGVTIDRMAAAEQQTRQGEVVVDTETVPDVAARFVIGEWRSEENPAANGPERRYAVVAKANEAGALPQAPLRLPFELAESLTKVQVRPWLLPPVYERLSRGQEQFLAEFRLAVPLLMRFSGIDFDGDDDAVQKLDAFIKRVQNILAYYGGYLIQLTIGDKGSYVYGAFGAPLAHHDDPDRAVAAALKLRSVSETFQILGSPVGQAGSVSTIS